MLIAIHHQTSSFSQYWISFCKRNSVPYRLVNCYSSDIIRQISDCDGLMWHWNHMDYPAALFARQLTLSLEMAGIAVFPNTRTAWHYDDKIGQKYLFEACKKPHVPTYIFFRKRQAFEWVENTDFPKVFKLRRGAGSQNVELCKTRAQARKQIWRAFGRGFNDQARKYAISEMIWGAKKGNFAERLRSIAKGIVRGILPRQEFRNPARLEWGYVYFQDFVPNNAFDIRIIVIGERAFALKRYVRQGDFRASGSGHMSFRREEMPLGCISLSFEVALKLHTQCIALDFVFDRNSALVVEISYAFSHQIYYNCEGYWTPDLQWRPDEVIPEHLIIEDFLKQIQQRNDSSEKDLP